MTTMLDQEPLSTDAAMQLLLERSAGGLPGAVSFAAHAKRSVPHNEHQRVYNLSMFLSQTLQLPYLYAPPPAIVALAIRCHPLQLQLLQLSAAKPQQQQQQLTLSSSALALLKPGPETQQATVEELREQIAELQAAAARLADTVLQQRRDKAADTRQHSSGHTSNVGDSVLDRHMCHTPEQLQRALAGFAKGGIPAAVMRQVQHAHKATRDALAAPRNLALVPEGQRPLFDSLDTGLQHTLMRRLVANTVAGKLTTEEKTSVGTFDNWLKGELCVCV